MRKIYVHIFISNTIVQVRKYSYKYMIISSSLEITLVAEAHLAKEQFSLEEQTRNKERFLEGPRIPISEREGQNLEPR
jgi:hypothetical protein